MFTALHWSAETREHTYEVTFLWPACCVVCLRPWQKQPLDEIPVQADEDQDVGSLINPHRHKVFIR